MGGALVFVALATMPFHIVALMDPVGTKMADDADPFGVLPSRTKVVVRMLITGAAGLAGVWLLKRGNATDAPTA
jgi:hypothetical protein